MSNLLAVEEFKQLKSVALYAVKSGFFGAVKSQEQAMMIMMTSQEMNMGPTWGLQNIFIIKGRPSLKAEGMLGLCFKNIDGFAIEYKSNTKEACEIKVSRNKSAPAVFIFAMEDAERAKLTTRWDNKEKQMVPQETWLKYPKDMLRSRCVSQMCRAYCPDALMGVSYTPEELNNIEPKDVNKPSTKTHDKHEEQKTTPSVESAKPSVVDVRTSENASPDLSSVPNHAPKPKDKDLEGGDFVIPEGKNKDKSLNELGYENVQALVNFYTENDTKVVKGWRADVVENFHLMKADKEEESHLQEMNDISHEYPHGKEDEIPF